MNEMKYAAFSANWQPGVPKYNWVNWQWAGFTNHTNTDIPGRTAHIQRRITNYSIVFQINKYVNLACFLNICKHIMVFLCFSRVKILHTAPLKRTRRHRLNTILPIHFRKADVHRGMDFLSYLLIYSGKKWYLIVVFLEIVVCLHNLAKHTT